MIAPERHGVKPRDLALSAQVTLTHIYACIWAGRLSATKKTSGWEIDPVAADVLGIIALTPTLIATNGILGAPATFYDNFPNGQGYEFTPPCPGLQDSVTLSSDRRTVTVCTTVYGANDDLRIILKTKQITYFVDGFGNFGVLDLTSGATKIIGAGTVSGNTGLDLTPTGQVYEYNISNQLLKVDASTGATTLVGSGTIPNPGLTTTGGLTNGSYFAVEATSGNLYSISLSTGATTLVGSTGTALLPQNCGFETSLAGSASVLYYT